MQFTENTRIKPRKLPSARVHGFWRSLIFAVILSIASVLGAFKPLDGLLYDAFVRNMPNATAVTRKVVLVESPASSFADSTIRWDSLADDLIARGAAQVVFTAVPTDHDEVIEALLRNPKVILSASLNAGASQPGEAIFNLPGGLKDLPLHAASIIADPLLGVHRSQRYAYQASDRDVPSLEALVASRLGIDVPREGRYLVEFNGSASGFPRASLNQILNGEVLDGMVRDRVILIGPASDGFHRTVVTPVTEGGREVSELEYHGYALDTLLRDKAVASFSPVVLGAVVIGFWLICLPILQPMQFRRAVLTAFFIAAGVTLFSWLLLSRGFHFPVLGPILVIASSLVSIFLGKSESQNQALARLVTETNLAASGRLTGQSVPFDDAFWSNVLAMIDQILPITRAVLLERVEASKRVCEVRSLRCNTAAIEERRRDFGRAPYSTAIENNEAIEVRRYLMDAERDEHQFLAPLVWSGQVLGFWAFGIHRSQMANRPMLMRAVDMLSKQLSELMYERRQRIAQPTIPVNWSDLLVDQRDLSIQKLTQNMNMIDRHINVLEDIFNGMDVPTMMYDLFGRPLFSNVRMKAFLQAADVRAEERSVADLLETVCALSAAEVRAALVGVVFNGEIFERAVQVGGTRFRLHVSRLRNSAARVMADHEMLQHTHGLMIQMFSIAKNADMRELDHSKSASRAAAPERGRMPEQAQAVPEAEEEVDVLDAVEEAIASTASSYERDTLSFAVNRPDRDAKVLAHPGKLKDILTALIQFLAEDSKMQGKITVNVDTGEDGLVIGLQNNGFGMPDDKLQAMLEGAALPRSDYLRRIRQLRDSAFGTHGQLDLRSTVGGGYVATATMRLAG